MNVPVRTAERGAVIEAVIAKGDLSKLTAEERTQYYVQLCHSMGMNPHTQPFAYITLNGKLTLYAKRDAADQLRKINGVSIEIVEQKISGDLLSVHVRARDKGGRTDEDFGVVPFSDTLKGEARANAILKAVTKAKRRVTLSISGLGFLDESEIDSIPHARARAFDAETGEVLDSPPPHRTTEAVTAAPSSLSPEGGAADKISLEDEARAAASRGRPVFAAMWRRLSDDQRKQLSAIQDDLGKLMKEAEDASA